MTTPFSTPPFTLHGPSPFWALPDVVPLLGQLRLGLQAWSDTLHDPDAVRTARQNVEHHGDLLESRYRAWSRTPSPRNGPRWSFLNAPLGGGRSDLDDGVANNEPAGGKWQHPLMTAVRYSALAAIELIVDRGHLRPTGPREPMVDEEGQTVVDHLEDTGVDSRYGRPGTAEVAVVLARRGLPGGLAVLQRYETDPGALSQQAMFWIAGAVDHRRASVIGEAQPWFDPAVRATPPFESPMDDLLTHDPDLVRNRATTPAGLEGVDTDHRLNEVLDALLALAPWDAWRHQDSTERLQPCSATDWLGVVIDQGACWAFDRLFPTACPDPVTFDRWCEAMDRVEPGLLDENVERGQRAMRQRVAHHLLSAALDTPEPDAPGASVERRRL